MQKPRLSIALAVTALAVLVAASCQPAMVGSRFVKSEKVGSGGATISVAETESLALQGTRLEVTAGAVPADTTITLEVGLADVVPAASAAGPVAVWEPSGLRFLKPVKMTLPLVLQAGQSDADLSIMVVEGDGTRARIARSQLELDATRTHVSFMVNGFTSFQPMSGQRCMATADCIASETCVSSVCTPAGGTGGGTATCTPSAETCDGADNDCDGMVDDGATCASGQVCTSGACVAMGVMCTTVRDCSPAQQCVGGFCVGGGTGGGSGGSGGGGGSSGTGGGSSGTGGGSSGTGGGAPGCGTCPTGQTCWGGACQLIACDPVRGCPSPLTCIMNSCQ